MNWKEFLKPTKYFIFIIFIFIVLLLIRWVTITSEPWGPVDDCRVSKVTFCIRQSESDWIEVIVKCGNFDDCYNFCSSEISEWKPAQNEYCRS